MGERHAGRDGLESPRKRLYKGPSPCAGPADAAARSKASIPLATLPPTGRANVSIKRHTPPLPPTPRGHLGCRRQGGPSHPYGSRVHPAAGLQHPRRAPWQGRKRQRNTRAEQVGHFVGHFVGHLVGHFVGHSVGHFVGRSVEHPVEHLVEHPRTRWYGMEHPTTKQLGETLHREEKGNSPAVPSPIPAIRRHGTRTTTRSPSPRARSQGAYFLRRTLGVSHPVPGAGDPRTH